MYAIDALKEAAKKACVPSTHIGRNMGYTDNYVAKIANRGSVPRCDTMARMLDVCGFGLYAIPYEQAPKDALQITAEGME